MAEIGASRRVWPEAKHQLCWWHQREALRRRLKGNLPTSPYNPQRAANEYNLIDITFKPYGRVDLNDNEGGVPGENCEPGTQRTNVNTTPLTSDNPNSIKIRIPLINLAQSSQTIQSTGDNASGSAITSSDPTLARTCHDPLDINTQPADTTKLTIRIPAASTVHDSSTEDRRSFCPAEHRETIIVLMERHFCAHPLIPGSSFASPEGIKAWAVKQMYEFCVLYDLPNLWAYLWENWYRRGRWELWARSANPKEVPRLKTTMLVEGQ